MSPSIDRIAAAEPATWTPLYRLAGIAALAMLGLMIAQMVMFAISPPPSFLPTHDAALAWFALFESRPVVALVHLDALFLVDYVLVILLYLALAAALRRHRPVTALVSVVLACVSAAVYLASNPAFTMMSLAAEYRASSGVAPHAELLAAAQSALAVYHGSPFDVAYVLSAIAGLLMCSAMLRSEVFSTTTAYVGLVTYGMNLVPATAGNLGLVLSVVSLMPLAVWLVLVASRLLRMR